MRIRFQELGDGDSLPFFLMTEVSASRMLPAKAVNPTWRGADRIQQMGVFDKYRKDKKPRELVQTDVDEVSIVDAPSTGVKFLLTKRRKGMATHKELVDDTTACMNAIAEEIHKRLKEVGDDKEPTWANVIQKDEGDSMSGLLVATEKVFGPYGHPFPFRKEYPIPFSEIQKQAYPYPKPKDFDASVLSASLRRVLSKPDIPDAVKNLLLDAIKRLDMIAAGKQEEEPKDEDEKFVTRKELADTVEKLTEMITDSLKA